MCSIGNIGKNGTTRKEKMAGRIRKIVKISADQRRLVFPFI
jgi:hypothetical protein